MRTVPPWYQYFMNIAEVVSSRSKDPHTNVGCVIVNKEKHIIATGYNGMPEGMVEDEALWQRPTKYDYVIHAEANALRHCAGSLKEATLFSTLYPCKECAKLIAASGIKTVYYKHDVIEGKDYKSVITEDIMRRSNIDLIKI